MAPRFRLAAAAAILAAAAALGLSAPREKASPASAAAEMAPAAANFLASLGPEQRALAAFEFGDDERLNWHYIPRDRKGLALKDMTSVQRTLAHGLLSTGLSHRGYVKAVTIMTLEQILADLEGPGRQFPRDPDLYYVSIFGTPADGAAWGWRVEGHHLSVNFAIAGGEVVGACPSFLGTNPGRVLDGPRKGLWVLETEETLARDLARSLGPEQRKKGVFSEEAPDDVLTGGDRKVEEAPPPGIPAAALNADQSALLLRLLEEHVGRLRGEVAERELAKIRKDWPDRIHFAWAGGLEARQGHYYRIQGPAFLIEYANTQNDANHAHAVWRDLANDFGEDLLRRHYEQNPHRK
jgi:hypothetical protein